MKVALAEKSGYALINNPACNCTQSKNLRRWAKYNCVGVERICVRFRAKSDSQVEWCDVAAGAFGSDFLRGTERGRV